MNETFAVFFVMNEQFYPIALTKEQDTMLQMTIKAVLGNHATIIDKPFGQVTNLVDEKKTNEDGNPS